MCALHGACRWSGVQQCVVAVVHVAFTDIDMSWSDSFTTMSQPHNVTPVHVYISACHMPNILLQQLEVIPGLTVDEIFYSI